MKKGSALALLLAIVLPSAAAADPINITSGSLNLASTAGTLVLAGDRGFTFSAPIDSVSAFIQPIEQCNFSAGCAPGAALGLAATLTGNDLTGTATLDGLTYSKVGGLESPSSLSIAFAGTAVLPPLSATGSLTAPFLFSGTFLHPMDEDGVVSDVLGGRGFATLSLSSGGGSWHLDSARYVFDAPQATPEPGPVFLVGAGLIGLAAMVRRGGRSSRAL